MQGIHTNPNQAEKGKSGGNTVKKDTASQCAYQYGNPVNTQICKIIITAKTYP